MNHQAAGNVCFVMGRYARVAGCAVLATLTACGSQAAGGGVECAGVGSRTGIGLDIQAPYATKVTEAAMKVCWDGRCRTFPVLLAPSTVVVPGDCPTGDSPDAACGATASLTGGKHGFADVPGLPEAPVEVTVLLRDGRGRTLVEQKLAVTPSVTYTVRPECGEGAPQAQLKVVDGRVSA